MMPKKQNLWIWYLYLILPFLAGCFHTYMYAVTAAVLLFGILEYCHRYSPLRFLWNTNAVMCCVLVLGYSLTPLWAADKGMAIFGIARYLPFFLLAVLLMQIPRQEKTEVFRLIPVCGAAMTLICCIIWLFPAASSFVTVNGRLSGFLQYPNTFAAFLLVGIAVQGTKKRHAPLDWSLDILLLAGIFLSGSRTAVLLLVFEGIGLTVVRGILRPAAGLAAGSILVVLCAVFIRTGQQITFLGRDIGSLFVRILYYKDAIPVILKHPFGLGYMGYRALETTFQTSRYTVSFVHSGLLQLLLDIGWIPAILFLTAVCRTLWSKHTTATEKMVLLVLTAHSMVDFNLQFFLFWGILLLCLDFESGIEYRLSVRRPLILAAVVFILCSWLGLGDLLYQTGHAGSALKVTPFHTDALSYSLKQTAEPDQLDYLADRILKQNPTHALAYSAKANAAFARGQVTEMIQYKEEAIRLTPYTTEEYCDYIQKLYTLLEHYVSSGDMESAAFCLERMLSVPEKMAQVSSKTDPLADLTGNDTTLELPEAYRQLLDLLAAENGLA